MAIREHTTIGMEVKGLKASLVVVTFNMRTLMKYLSRLLVVVISMIYSPRHLVSRWVVLVVDVDVEEVAAH